MKRRVLVPAKVEITPGGKIRVFVSAGVARRIKSNPAGLSKERKRQIELEEYAAVGKLPEWRKREIEAEEKARIKKNPSSGGYKVARIPGYRSYAIYRVGDTPSTKNWVAGPFRTKKEAMKRLETW